jgi:hypothetical protein
MLFHAQLPKYFWVDAFMTAVYLINRLPSSVLKMETPFFKLHETHPDYNSLKVFGCRCFPYLRDYAKKKLTTSASTQELWSPQPEGTFKVNFDTAIKKQFSVQAVVCRDSKGHITKALSQISPPCDANYGEALVAQLVVSLGLKTISLEGDSTVVIAALKTPVLSQDWHVNSVIAATLSSIPASSSREVRKVHRSANFCIHHVACWAATRGFSGCIPTFFSLIPLLPLLSPFVVERPSFHSSFVL